MKKYAIIVLTMVIFTSFAVLAHPAPVSSCFSDPSSCSFTEKTFVNGIVYDEQEGTPIVGADVTVNCNGVNKNTVSGVYGTYEVEYNPLNCSDGDNVVVVAVKGGLSGSKSGEVFGDGATFNLAIIFVPMTPEFGFYMGGLTLISAVGVFFLVRRD